MPLPPRLRWKLTRYRNQLDEKLERARNLMLGVFSQQRMCPACRALVDRKDTVCPFCDQRLTGGSGGPLDPLLSSFIPDQMRFTVFFLTINVFLFMLTLAASMTRMGGDLNLFG